ncbi:uncharacterized protein C8Q71DRAFT_737056 [Rhodofomes roseus]|uniref:BTB domain-containing protein n=1 Tax=Rhodofomes roseus TaxID=34475 RepID=A0ABQ8KRM2_9APHY|nr:uncharacterized protein C8Q71DRAFT_737056 [Rhodofomes roseus]KAH9841450.1 hypothetical protein C8Q71DRAFT_737056 [Rhodofomes roseus]
MMEVDAPTNATEQPTRDAPPPFDKTTGDVILRSSDRVDFRVRKAIMSEASSVFEDMFSLPQPPTDHAESSLASANSGRPGEPSTSSTDYKDGCPVIVMQERSKVLERLLRLCYPVTKPSLDYLDLLSPVLAAAVKYAMDGIVPTIRQDLRRLAKEEPLRVYCLAIHYGFAEEAEEAARASLQLPRRMLYVSVNLNGVPELELVDGRVPLLLLDYHQRCSDALVRLKRDVPFLSQDWVWMKCDADVDDCPSAGVNIKFSEGGLLTPTKWWWDYLVAVVDILKENPSSDAIRRDTLLLDKAIKEAFACEVCGELAQQHMRIFIDRLVSYVDMKVSKIRLPANVRKDAAPRPIIPRY